VTPESAAIRIVQLGRNDTKLLKQVEGQFADLHRVLEGYGIVTPLIPGGERIWLAGLEPMLGRLVGLTAAMDQEEQVLGFVHTTLVNLPAYLGGARAARLGHIYVAEAGRNLGLATRMWDVAEAWLRSKGVTSVEVQAQVTNTASRSLWPRLGFGEEVLQFRKMLN
jgi:GNAT superfamily N-acetyltransferase